MKKLLLVLLVVVSAACSSDNDDPVINEVPEAGLSIVYSSKSCENPQNCVLNYTFTNTSGKWKGFKVKYTFNRVDSHYQSNTYIVQYGSNENENYIIPIPVDAETENISAEIIDVVIIG